MRVALIETVSSSSPGSMHRYADLVEHVFHGHPEISVHRISLSGAESLLSRLPSRLRSWCHHAVIAWNALTLRVKGFDLVHLADGSYGYIVPYLRTSRIVATVHDVIPFLQSQGRFPVKPPGFLARMLIHRSLKGLRDCSSLLVDSESTRRDLEAAGFQGPEAMVCPLILEPHLFAPAETDEMARDGRPQILHIGNNGFYKNRRGVVEIFARVRRQVDAELILAGPVPSRDLENRIRELNLQDFVRIVVNPTDLDLRRWYQRASLLLFPSIYEGFGWPPLEAMASGCPVVCSREGSLPEVVADAALIGPVADVEYLATQCCRVLRDEELREDLRLRGLARASEFRLDRFRSTIEMVYRGVAEGSRNAAADVRSSSEPLRR